MPQNRVDHIVIDDERDNLHSRTATRAQQRVHLVDTLDELRPAPAESSGFGAVIPAGLNQGGMLDVSRRSAYGDLVVSPALAQSFLVLPGINIPRRHKLKLPIE